MRHEVRNPTGELIGVIELDPYQDRKYIQVPLMEPLSLKRDMYWASPTEEQIKYYTLNFERTAFKWRFKGIYNEIPTLIVDSGYLHLLKNNSNFKAV